MLTLKDTENMKANVLEIADTLMKQYEQQNLPVPPAEDLLMQAQCAWFWGTMHNILEKRFGKPNGAPKKDSGIVLLR